MKNYILSQLGICSAVPNLVSVFCPFVHCVTCLAETWNILIVLQKQCYICCSVNGGGGGG